MDRSVDAGTAADIVYFRFLFALTIVSRTLVSVNPGRLCEWIENQSLFG